MAFFILSYKKPDYFVIKYEYIQVINGEENIAKSGYCASISPIPNGAALTELNTARKFNDFLDAKKYISKNAEFRQNRGNRFWEDSSIYCTIYNWNELDTFDYEYFEIEEVFP